MMFSASRASPVQPSSTSILGYLLGITRYIHIALEGSTVLYLGGSGRQEAVGLLLDRGKYASIGVTSLREQLRNHMHE